MANTTISGALKLGLGLGPVIGSIKISNPAFTTGDGTFIPAGYSVTQIASDGTYDFTLAPNEGSSPPNSYYVASYYLQGGLTQYSEQWIVPASSNPLSIPQIRLNPTIPPQPFQINASQLYSATANVGDCLVFDGENYVSATLQSVFPFSFTSQTTFVIPGATHAQGTSLIVKVYDGGGNELDPSVNVNPLTGDVTLQFDASTSGSGFVYGGLARSLPNFSACFFNQSTATIKQSQHRFNTPNLDAAIYDALTGDLIDGECTVQLSSSFDVTVAFAYPQNFKIVIVGCLGVTSPAVPQQQQSGSELSATADLNAGTVQDGDALSLGTIVVTGASVGRPVLANSSPALPSGLQLVGKVGSANAVSIELWNTSGAAQTPGQLAVTVLVF